MISELPGDIGPLDPGVDELFRTLTSEPMPAELADEQSALAMFRANVSSSASQPPAPIPTAPTPTIPTGPTRISRSAPGHARPVSRLFRRSGGWGIRLAAAVVIVLAIALASAAYTATLPQPIQLLAHRVLGAIGVPSPPHSGHTSRPPARHRHSGSLPAGHSPGHASPGQSAPAGSPSPHPHKSGAATASPSPSVSHSPSVASGPAQLSASASSAEIVAGSPVTIDGQFTRSGAGAQGVTIQLMERFVGHRLWHLAGTAQTMTGGNVRVTVSAVTANAVFRLRDKGVAHSANVLVIADPVVTATLTPGAAGLRDVLAVSTQYAHRGNLVQLEVQTSSGSWKFLRQRRLNATGNTTFVLGGKRLANLEVRVVLLATARHGSSISNTQTVPPPS